MRSYQLIRRLMFSGLTISSPDSDWSREGVIKNTGKIIPRLKFMEDVVGSAPISQRDIVRNQTLP